jgi:hypothetical protein
MDGKIVKLAISNPPARAAPKDAATGAPAGLSVMRVVADERGVTEGDAPKEAPAAPRAEGEPADRSTGRARVTATLTSLAPRSLASRTPYAVMVVVVVVES